MCQYCNYYNHERQFIKNLNPKASFGSSNRKLFKISYATALNKPYNIIWK